ncbi:hypothetical protein L1987_64523 [Smallanthus sonchifolius]|uniref:Uncharacterized protein n=1 Tax=Smallanthus sonchifolius TaxID=185202 RepID=A0ACB9BRY7_9ASTR|nr:hypothetical protein L1987_64523 [Smallanthus sonchifolius]
MESARKETKRASRRGSGTDPPDPGVEGKFWDVEEGSDEGVSGDEKATTKIGLSRRNGNRKGKSKPSHSLDGSMESALRRYSLRSEDSGVLGISKPHASKKSKVQRQDLVQRVGEQSLLDKENTQVPLNHCDDGAVNLLDDEEVGADLEESPDTMQDVDEVHDET